MFFNKKAEKAGRAQCLIEKYQQWTEHDEKKRRYSFPMLFSALFCQPQPQHIRYIGNEAKALLSGRDAFFAACLMRGYYAEITEADTDAWKQACPPDGYRALLICGSAVPNGYFREYCLKRLADERDVLPFILLRMNDWVPAIRKSAWNLLWAYLRRETSVSEIIQAMPFVEYVRHGRRVQRDASFSMDTLDDALMKVFAAHPEAVLQSPVSLRRLCYRVFLLHPDSGYSDLILHFIRSEQDSAQRSALVRLFLKNAAHPVSAALVDEFMKDKYPRIRLNAYEYRIQHAGVWDGMESLLCSAYCPIREFAAYYLEKSGFDTAAYCRSHLPDTILALGGLGSADDIPLLRPYLESHPCETLISLVRLEAEDSRELVWQAIYSSNPRLAKIAYRLAEKRLHATPSELLPRIAAETNPQRRWRLIRMLGSNAGWNLMPVLIRLVRDYSHLRSDIIAKIERISHYRDFGVHALFVSAEQYAEITEALAYARGYLPQKLADYLELHMRVEQ